VFRTLLWIDGGRDRQAASQVNLDEPGLEYPRETRVLVNSCKSTQRPNPGPWKRRETDR
jgi:hypothetical protein